MILIFEIFGRTKFCPLRPIIRNSYSSKTSTGWHHSLILLFFISLTVLVKMVIEDDMLWLIITCHERLWYFMTDQQPFETMLKSILRYVSVVSTEDVGWVILCTQRISHRQQPVTVKGTSRGLWHWTQSEFIWPIMTFSITIIPGQ